MKKVHELKQPGSNKLADLLAEVKEHRKEDQAGTTKFESDFHAEVAEESASKTAVKLSGTPTRSSTLHLWMVLRDLRKALDETYLRKTPRMVKAKSEFLKNANHSVGNWYSTERKNLQELRHWLFLNLGESCKGVEFDAVRTLIAAAVKEADRLLALYDDKDSMVITTTFSRPIVGTKVDTNVATTMLGNLCSVMPRVLTDDHTLAFVKAVISNPNGMREEFGTATGKFMPEPEPEVVAEEKSGESGDAKKPEGGDAKKPEGGDAKKPEGGDAKKPEGGDAKKPEGGDAKKPEGGDAKKPEGGDAKKPEGGDAKKPEGGDAKKPEGGEAKKPEGGDAKKPEGGDAKKPEGGDAKKPEGGDAKKPEGGDAKKPEGGDAKKPEGGDAKKPEGGDAKKPDGASG